MSRLIYTFITNLMISNTGLQINNSYWYFLVHQFKHLFWMLKRTISFCSLQEQILSFKRSHPFWKGKKALKHWQLIIYNSSLVLMPWTTDLRKTVIGKIVTRLSIASYLCFRSLAMENRPRLNAVYKIYILDFLKLCLNWWDFTAFDLASNVLNVLGYHNIASQWFSLHI